MKIGFNPGSIVDASGAPLQGRVLVYVHDSLEKKDIFTLQGSEYVASENPVLLDTTGRISTTLFFDVGVVDVLVQKYVGAPGQLADDSPDEDFEDFDRFEAGFDFDPTQAGTTEVETIADLKDIENPSGVVRVNCYTTPGDTFQRYYLWNPNCTASEDGGCVIADSHDASGMWCYLCEGDCIKSSVYGIKPGTDETNLGAFCGAPLSVMGTYTVKYPISLYVESGTYSTNMSYFINDDRKVVFSCKSKFTGASFYAPSIDVDGYCSDYVADFYFSNQTGKSTAYLSWYRTAFAFWASRAKTLVLDDDANLSSNVIDGTPSIYGATVISQYEITFNFTFQPTSRIAFYGVTFIGRFMFNGSTFVGIFDECNFSDRLFSNSSNIDFGTLANNHRVEVRNWEITDSHDPNVWLAWANAAGVTIADLCGRLVTNLYNSNIQEFRNGVFQGGTVSTNVNVKFTDIGGSVVVYPTSAGKSLTLDHCNNVNISSGTPFSSIVARDSNVVASTVIDNSVTSYSHDGGTVQATFKCAGWDATEGTHTKGKEIILRNVVLSIGNFSWFDCVRMNGCTVNNPIHVIPYAENGDLWLDAIFENNTFGSNGYIAFTDSSTYNPDIYEVKIKSLFIKNNVFGTSGQGVQMPFYSRNANKKYIGSLQDLNATYSGNVGSCPEEAVEFIPYEMQSVYTIDEGGFKRNNSSHYVWNLSNNEYFVKGSGLQISADHTQSRFISTYLYHEEAIDNSGGQFDVFLSIDADDYIANSVIKVFDK